MKRRDFIQKTALSGSLVGLGSASLFANQKTSEENKFEKGEFQLNYAPHFGMFESVAGKDLVDQLNFMADKGFTAFEDNDMRNRPVTEQEAIAKTMMKRDMKMGVFVAHTISWSKPDLVLGDTTIDANFLTEIKDSIEVAKRVNAKWMTVVLGPTEHRMDIGYQNANVISVLKRACKLLEPHGIIMVLEPLNFYNHPGLFLAKSAHAYEICKAVNSPSCKILFDIYHQQITEGNLIPNIEACWDEIAYFQIGDNPGRNEPTTGEINYKNVFKHIHQKGYTGILGMEHGNSVKGKEGAQKVIEAYKEVDSF
ncbi:hydroxypyruvate isomerase [Pustulibacterium marinum]|uniref:Hydroxypyruvate isomerase n=1 Tax=Pustulibacterium marinum TaxID=1224947 RepID=A0A1I7I8B4_9FLAO|nr:TIM barrel protein [Pustulibacterium marinum]SFU69026.1 hydroxypyruvate isomerase [Pustulibacterium marinum]